MPELPEVETVRRSLEPVLIGRTIDRLEVHHPKVLSLSPDLPAQLFGCTFTRIDRVAKLLLFSFKQTSSLLCVHLKLTGQLVWRNGDTLAGGGHSLRTQKFDMPHEHTRATFHLIDGTKLFFNDLRLFGYLKMATPEQVKAIRAAYGIEPNTHNFVFEDFEAVLKRHRKTNIKSLLLNQERIAGLGNIYVDEACFASGISQKRRVGTITPKERRSLFKACNDIIARAVKAGGTTFQYFNLADGKKGDFRDHLQVFARQGEACFRCGVIIVKEQWAGRGTHYCPTCQK